VEEDAATQDFIHKAVAPVCNLGTRASAMLALPLTRSSGEQFCAQRWRLSREALHSRRRRRTFEPAAGWYVICVVAPSSPTIVQFDLFCRSGPFRARAAGIVEHVPSIRSQNQALPVEVSMHARPDVITVALLYCMSVDDGNAWLLTTPQKDACPYVPCAYKTASRTGTIVYIIGRAAVAALLGSILLLGRVRRSRFLDLQTVRLRMAQLR
jgi:hypothetical protein